MLLPELSPPPPLPFISSPLLFSAVGLISVAVRTSQIPSNIYCLFGIVDVDCVLAKPPQCKSPANERFAKVRIVLISQVFKKKYSVILCCSEMATVVLGRLLLATRLWYLGILLFRNRASLQYFCHCSPPLPFVLHPSCANTLTQAQYSTADTLPAAIWHGALVQHWPALVLS